MNSFTANFLVEGVWLRKEEKTSKNKIKSVAVWSRGWQHLTGFVPLKVGERVEQDFDHSYSIYNKTCNF